MIEEMRFPVLAQLIEQEALCPCRYDTAVLSRWQQLWGRVERYLSDSEERTVIETVIRVLYE